MNEKDPILKEEFHTNYKRYKNLLSALMKRSKQAYYDKYFEANWIDCMFLSCHVRVSE